MQIEGFWIGGAPGDGSNPFAPLALGNDGNLYGTTTHGRTDGGGTVFRIILTPQFTGTAKSANGSVVIAGTGPAGSPYRVWFSSVASAPVASWTLLTNGFSATDGTFSNTDIAATAAPARFQRLSNP